MRNSTENVEGVSFVSEMLTVYFTFLLSKHLSSNEIFLTLIFFIDSKSLLFYDIHISFVFLSYCAETEKRQCFSHECFS